MLKIREWLRRRNKSKELQIFSTKPQLFEPYAAQHYTNQQEIEPIFGEHFGVLDFALLTE